MQSREAGQSIGGRGCQRECLQDPGRPGNAPEGQVVVDSGSSLVGRWRCRARAGRKGPPAEKKARRNRTNTPHSKAMQRKAKPNQKHQTHTQGKRQAYIYIISPSGALRELSVALCRSTASLCRSGAYVATRAAGRAPMRGLAQTSAEVV
jgi:hypothetical protein